MPNLSPTLLIILVIVAVIAGLFVGNMLAAKREQRARTSQTLGEKAQRAATRGVVRLWKWNRSRKKNREGSSNES